MPPCIINQTLLYDEHLQHRSESPFVNRPILWNIPFGTTALIVQFYFSCVHKSSLLDVNRCFVSCCSFNFVSCLQCSNIIDIRTACITTTLQAIIQAVVCNLTQSYTWSNIFLSFLSNNDLNCFHFVRSISAAILNEGTVLPTPTNHLMMLLKKTLL
jgi:hypothetical protein